MTRPLVMAICVGLTALTVYGAGLAPELTPRSNLDQDLAFQVTDPAWLQRALPRVGGPDGWWPSGLIARGWASLPSSWNLNLLSAVLASSAAALLTFIVAGLAGRPAGAVAGLSFALSPAVWAIAVAAEGDTSALFLTFDLLFAVACAAAWARTGHRAPLAGAVSALGLAVAQDLVIGLAATFVFVATVPRDRRPLLWPLGIAAAALVVAVMYQGWALEAVTPLRPDEGAPSGIAEAWATMWRWGFEPGATAGDILQARTAALTSVVMLNIGVLGCIVGALGLQRSVPLLGGITALAVAACLGPVPGVWDPDTRGLVALTAAWGLVGLGLGRVASWTAVGGRSISFLLCVMLSVFQGIRTTAAAPRLIDRPAGQLLHAFVHQQTGAAAVVVENVRFGRLMAWANQRRQPSRRFDLALHDPDRLSALLAEGKPVFATAAAADRVSLSGLRGPTFHVHGRSLHDLLQSTSRRALVGLVATPGAFDTHPEAQRDVAQLARDTTAGGFGVDQAFLLLARRADGIGHLVSDAERVEVSPGTGVAPAFQPSLLPEGGARLVADRSGARLQADALELAHVTSGAIFAAWSPLDGSLDWSVLDRRHGLTAPWRHGAWAFSRLGPRGDCALVGRGEWSDVTQLATAARIGVELPRGGHLRLYVARDRGLFVRSAAFPRRPSAHTTIDSWDRSLADQASAATAALAADGLAPQDWPATSRFLWRVTIAASEAEPALLSLGLGGSPDWVRARLEPGVASRDATLCAGVAGARLFARDGLREDSLSLADGDSFGDGWLPMTRLGRERWRQSSGPEADVLARLDVPETLEVALSARPAPPPARPGRIGLRVNGVPVEAYDLRQEEATYAWTVPRERWRVGTNHLVVTVAPAESQSSVETSAPVLHVTSIRFRR